MPAKIEKHTAYEYYWKSSVVNNPKINVNVQLIDVPTATPFSFITSDMYSHPIGPGPHSNMMMKMTITIRIPVCVFKSETKIKLTVHSKNVNIKSDRRP